MRLADSNHYNCNMLRQHKFLTALVEKLDSAEECAKVLSDLEEVRQVITDPRHMVVHLAANVDQLGNSCQDPAQLWKQMLSDNKPPADKNK